MYEEHQYQLGLVHKGDEVVIYEGLRQQVKYHEEL
jgi:hypothetical protein